MKDSNNHTSLTNGSIPAGQACPYLERCKFKFHTCPGVDGKTKAHDFSCPAAKAFVVADKADQEKPGTGYILRRHVEKEQLIVLEVPKKRFSWGAFPKPEEKK